MSIEFSYQDGHEILSAGQNRQRALLLLAGQQALSLGSAFPGEDTGDASASATPSPPAATASPAAAGAAPAIAPTPTPGPAPAPGPTAGGLSLARGSSCSMLCAAAGWLMCRDKCTHTFLIVAL